MTDVHYFTISLKTAEGTPAFEPDCSVTFLRTDQTTVAGSAAHVVFPPDRKFALPAYPQERNLYCTIRPTLYQAVKSDFFVPSSDRTQTITAMRLPGQWSPTFIGLADLAMPRFDAFKQVVARSTQVDVKHGDVLGSLADRFDSLTGNQQVLAKMALLNLYAVLTDEIEPIGKTNWFRFVQQIVRIDQERFVAEADPALYTIVKTVLDNLDQYKSQGFFTESAKLHYGNIPDRYALTSDLITIKVRYEQGNVQFTMAHAKTNTDNRDVVLLDCDMDENGNILKHTGDLFIHALDGGTHPIDMHEYIVSHDPGVQLGYLLYPIGAPLAAGATAG